MRRPGSPDNWIDGLYDLMCMSICGLFVNEFYLCLPLSSGAAWATPWSCVQCRWECRPFGTWSRLSVSSWPPWRPSSPPPLPRVQRSSAPQCWPERPLPTSENGDCGSPLNGEKKQEDETRVGCLIAGMPISVNETPQSLSQTVSSFPPWSLCVFLWLPPTSCN